MKHIKGVAIVECLESRTKKGIEEFYPGPNSTLICVGDFCMPQICISSVQNEKVRDPVFKNPSIKKIVICIYIVYTHIVCLCT